jgi:hypothetical protein
MRRNRLGAPLADLFKRAVKLSVVDDAGVYSACPPDVPGERVGLGVGLALRTEFRLADGVLQAGVLGIEAHRINSSASRIVSA